MKRLLILGGPVFQKRVVEKAHEMGLYVGLMDINDDAPAAELADEFFGGSILDKAAALEVAHEFKPDAIMSGACDTSVRTVAWLCAKLGLPQHHHQGRTPLRQCVSAQLEPLPLEHPPLQLENLLQYQEY